jgi:PKD repeat protein
MLNKIKLIYSVITLFFIGVALVLFLNGNSTSDLSFKSQYKSEPEVISPVNATDSFKCGTMDIYNKMIKEDPDYERRLRELEVFTKNYIKNINPANRTVVTIPVVVHIVYNTPVQNISNATVQSQIDVLNKDFRRLNADTVNTPPPFKPLGGDPQIEFVLAKRDLLGNPSIGITRTQTSVVAFVMGINATDVMFTALGGHDIWNRNKYLNIWVCNLSGATGYASTPGENPAYDGAVVHYTVFGIVGPALPVNAKGRTATHEIGHWFNLQHIWGDAFCGDDFVDDTPTQQAPNNSCPGFPHITCNNGPNGDMFSNYMDYTSGDCQNIFTSGQCNRMNAALYGLRTSLLTSDGGIPVSGIPIAHFRSDKMNINFGQSINFFDESGGIPTGWQWTFDGGIPLISNQQNPSVTYPNAGLYSVKLRVTNSYGTDSVNYINYVKVLGVNMSAFSVVYPPSYTSINTSAADTARSIFTWTKSGSHPSIRYKWKIRKYGTSTEVTYNSNNNGSDSLITLRNNLLDSIAMSLGGNRDTVTCIWRVFSYNGVDSLISQNQNLVYLVRHAVGINVISSTVPNEFKLFQNYPNPFNPVTRIRFEIPLGLSFPKAFIGNPRVQLIIYDILGKEIVILVNESIQPGTYEVTLDGSNYSSGIYFYKLFTSDFTDTKRLVLLK